MESDGKKSEPSGRHGIYNLSEFQISRHARQRFHERFQVDSESQTSNPPWADMLRSCRKLGVKQDGSASYITIYGDVPVVLIEQDQVILTCMTQDQFETVMADFGRNRWPRKPGRWLKRIKSSSHEQGDDQPPV
jgi:hypothetical protein